MKNPWMSMWLSAANSMAAPARGLMAAEMKRSQNAAIEAFTEAATKQMLAFWAPLTPVPVPVRKTRRRRR